MRSCACLLSTACLLIAVGVAASDTGKPEPEPRIARLIQQLGDDDFARREAASEELDRIGEPALDALRKVAESSSDAEIRHRAGSILRALAHRATAKAQDTLRGAWSLLTYEQDGKLVKGHDKTHLMTFQGDRWSITVGGTVFQGGTIAAIESTAKHNTIDLLITEGSNPGAIAYSIYKIEGDTLRYLNSGWPRVSELATKPGDGRHYLTFRRVSK